MGATHISTHRTASDRDRAHAAIASHSRERQYGPLPPHMRLAIFSVSTLGSLGAEAAELLQELSRRTGRAIPSALLAEASWATPGFAPFARAALSCTVRRGLASEIQETWVGLATDAEAAPAAPLLLLGPGPPPPPRALPPPPFSAPAVAVPRAMVAVALFGEGPLGDWSL